MNALQDGASPLDLSVPIEDRVLLGVTTARLNGRWQVPVDPLASGLYFAAAPKADRNDGGVEFVCERAVSRLLVVD